MKKIFFMLATAGFLASCNTPNAEKTINTTQTGTTTTVYSPAEGDVIMKEGTTMTYTNGVWVANTGSTTMKNGMVITKEGVVTQDSKTVYLREGDAVNKTGNFFDRTGVAIDNAWDATKRGANQAAEATKNALEDAGKAIGKGARKIGDKTDSMVKDIRK